MNKIIIAYWMLQELPNLKYKHHEEFDYSIKKRNSIITKVLKEGYNIMLQQSESDQTLIMWIDTQKFTQR